MLSTLYDKLKRTEERLDNYCEYYDVIPERNPSTLFDRLKKIERTYLSSISWPEYQQCLKNIADAQGKEIRSYKDHPIMSEVMAGKTTLEAVTKDILKPYQRLGFLLPYSKDEKHNKRVEDLSELIPRARCLKTRGLFAPDNMVAGYIYFNILADAGMSLIAPYPPPLIELKIFGAIAGLLCTCIARNPYREDYARMARHIDERVYLAKTGAASIPWQDFISVK